MRPRCSVSSRRRTEDGCTKEAPPPLPVGGIWQRQDVRPSCPSSLRIQTGCAHVVMANRQSRSRGGSLCSSFRPSSPARQSRPPKLNRLAAVMTGRKGKRPDGRGDAATSRSLQCLGRGEKNGKGPLVANRKDYLDSSQQRLADGQILLISRRTALPRLHTPSPPSPPFITKPQRTKWYLLGSLRIDHSNTKPSILCKQQRVAPATPPTTRHIITWLTGRLVKGGIQRLTEHQRRLAARPI